MSLGLDHQFLGAPAIQMLQHIASDACRAHCGGRWNVYRRKLRARGITHDVRLFKTAPGINGAHRLLQSRQHVLLHLPGFAQRFEKRLARGELNQRLAMQRSVQHTRPVGHVGRFDQIGIEGDVCHSTAAT
ncbi:hypothetical protein D3C77_226840 [compost metagenome]